MAMRLADTFSSIHVLALPFSFRGRLRTGVCPFFGITQPASIVRWIKRMNIEQMFANIAFTSC